MPQEPPSERPQSLRAVKTVTPWPSSISLATGRRHEILVKDRYTDFWIFNNELELLWRAQGQTGHFPTRCDLTASGRDQMVIGYAMWDRTGKQALESDDEQNS